MIIILRKALALMVIALAIGPAESADCTYQKDSLGQTRYRCDDGRKGTLRQDSLGRVHDSGTRQTWRQNSTGTWRSNDGQQMRKDSLGRVHHSNGPTWRTDTLGQQRSSDGTISVPIASSELVVVVETASRDPYCQQKRDDEALVCVAKDKC